MCKSFLVIAFVVMLQLFSSLSLYCESAPDIDSLQKVIKTAPAQATKMEARKSLARLIHREQPELSHKLMMVNVGLDTHGDAQLTRLKAESFIILSKLYMKSDVSKCLAFGDSAMLYLGTDPITEEYIEMMMMKGYKLMALNQIGQSIAVLQEAIELAAANELESITNRARGTLSRIYLMTHQCEKAILLLNKTEEWFRKQNQPRYVMGTLSYKAACYTEMDCYYKAVEAYYEALRYADEQGMSAANKTNVYLNLATTFDYLKDYHNAIKNYEKVVELEQAEHNPIMVAMAKCGIGTAYLKTGDWILAENHLLQADSMGVAIQHAAIEVTTKSSLGSLYMEMGQVDRAYPYLMGGLQLAQESGAIADLVKVQLNLSKYYNLKGDIANAHKYANQSLELAQKESMAAEMYDCYYLLATLQNRLKPDIADSWYAKALAYKDTVFDRERSKSIAAIEIAYETEKKEAQIELLQLQKRNNQMAIKHARRKNIALMVVIVFLFLLAVSLGLYWRQRQKSRLILQRVQAQEEEGARIARELHDGVAGQLGYLAYKAEKQLGNDDLVQIIHRTREDVRTLSHQLNTPVLVKQNFKDALAESLNLSMLDPGVDLQIRLEPIDLEINDYRLKMNVIRIIQEAFYNTQKHAEASKIRIAITKTEKELHLEYADNGVGVDSSKKINGQGLNNIAERIQSVSGVYEIVTAPGQGFLLKMRAKYQDRTVTDERV